MKYESLCMITIFWFRRDLRLYDNAGLFEALKNNQNVLPLFIFDEEILAQLESSDLRVPFIHQTLAAMKEQLNHKKSDFLIEYGKPSEVFKKLSENYKIKSIYLNHDYEPMAIARDQKIEIWAKSKNIEFKSFKDHVIFEKNEIQTDLYKLSKNIFELFLMFSYKHGLICDFKPIFIYCCKMNHQKSIYQQMLRVINYLCWFFNLKCYT